MKFAFAKTLMQEAKKDPRVIFLTGDLGFQLFDDFQKQFGPRYINVGVAEAAMVCTAAGLAHVGYKPLTYSIASFATARCYEQIKISVAYPALPVIIVGAGGGYAYGSSGATHHAGDDLGLMRGLPHMTVVAPADAHEVAALLPQLLSLKGPSYLRIGRGKEPSLNAVEPVVLGKARLLRQGEDIAFITTGEEAYEVSEALKILSDKGMYPVAYQFHTVKPLDTTTLDAIAQKIKTFVVVEEHLSIGGLVSAVNDWASQSDDRDLHIHARAIKDAFVLGSPSQSEIRHRYGLDAVALAGFVEKLLSRVVY